MWYSKKQATSETATYGSEFIACRTCCEQIIDLHNSFRYLGVPVYHKSYTFGDNLAQITSAAVPQGKLNKRHNILSFHFVRDLISKGFINIIHIASEFNASNILSKNWKYQASYENILKPFLHYEGNVGNLYINDETDFQHLTMKQPQDYERVVASSMTWDTTLNITINVDEEIELLPVQIGNY